MPDDDEYFKPGDFDLDGPFSQGEDRSLSDLASEFGWTDWRDIIGFEGGYDQDDMRPGIYFTAQDAILEAYNVGILDFSHIVYDEEEEVWHIVVDGDSDGGGS